MPKQNRKNKKGRTNKQIQSTNWVFTLNNYTQADMDNIAILPGTPNVFKKNDSVVKGIACSEEIGRKGTPHLQGYLQLSKKGIL